MTIREELPYVAELRRESLPAPKSGAYVLFDGEELVYVGESWNCLLRVGEHTRRDSEKIFDRWNIIPVEEELDRKRLEGKMKRAYRPRYNRA